MSFLTLQFPTSAQKRLPELDELKGLAILLVVLYHAGGTLAWGNLLHGDLGVDMFVIISAIGLTLGGSYPNARSFLLRRFSRIMPAYWLALAFYLVLNTHFLERKYTALNIGLHALGVHAFFGDQPLIREYVRYCLGRFFNLPQPTTLHLVGGMIVGFFITIELSMALRWLINALPLGRKEPTTP